MKLLVACVDPLERDRLLAVIADHFPCTGMSADESLLEAMQRVRPTMVIAERANIADVTMSVARPVIIGLVPANPTSIDLADTLAAGADDILRSGALKEEVWIRVANLARMKPRTTPMPTLTMRIGEVKVLQDIERIVAKELGELLGTSLQHTEGAQRPLVHTSVIPLTLVSDHVLVQLGIGVDEATRDKLVEVLLGGDGSCDAMRDALREMANTAGGAIRRAALDDGVSFSIGLPSDDNVFSGAGAGQRAWTVSDGNGLQLDCTVAMTANRPRRVDVGELREGMVVTRDVVATDGAVVVPAGTSLTTATAQQIGRVLKHGDVEVERA
jgi:hypothetical protein